MCDVRRMTLTTRPKTAADIRALIAYHRLRVYRLAPLVDLHPARLSLILNEHAPLSSDLAARLLRAIEEMRNER
jgi:hypothetical protein